MSRWQLVAASFVEVADTLLDDFEVLDFLQNLAGRAAEITGSAASAVTLANQRGELRLVATTDHGHRTVRLLTLATSEGPCLDVFRSGEPCTNVSSAAGRRRWPGFTEAARSAGYAVAHVVPMRIRSEVLGTLSVLYTREQALAADDQAILEALASVATVGLLQERTPRQRELVAERLQAALNLQVEVEQAKGVVSEVLGVDVNEAFGLLRATGQRHGISLSQVCEQVLRGDLAPTALVISPT